MGLGGQLHAPVALPPTKRHKLSETDRYIQHLSQQDDRFQTACNTIRFLSPIFKNIHAFLFQHNFKYTIAERKVTLDICQTPGLVTPIRTNFAIGTAISRTTNLYTFSEIAEFF